MERCSDKHQSTSQFLPITQPNPGGLRKSSVFERSEGSVFRQTERARLSRLPGLATRGSRAPATLSSLSGIKDLARSKRVGDSFTSGRTNRGINAGLRRRGSAVRTVSIWCQKLNSSHESPVWRALRGPRHERLGSISS